jgi:hypothetical protein
MWKEVALNCSQVAPYCSFLEVPVKSTKTLLKIQGLQVEVRKQHLRNTKYELQLQIDFRPNVSPFGLWKPVFFYALFAQRA